VTPRIRLFYHPVSHYCISAERMLRYKRLRFETVYTPYHDHQALIRASGQDYIPTLDWGGQYVTWSEIPTFLDRAQPDPALLPRGKSGLARTVESWGHLVLEERVWRAIVTRVPPLLRGDEERWVFEEMQTRSRGPFPLLERRRREFTADLAEPFALVDAMLADRDWILDEPTVADFGVYGAVALWPMVGERIPTRFPHLVRWAKRIRDL
jgi:glutathione S-transferase